MARLAALIAILLLLMIHPYAVLASVTCQDNDHIPHKLPVPSSISQPQTPSLMELKNQYLYTNNKWKFKLECSLAIQKVVLRMNGTCAFRLVGYRIQYVNNSFTPSVHLLMKSDIVNRTTPGLQQEEFHFHDLLMKECNCSQSQGAGIEIGILSESKEQCHVKAVSEPGYRYEFTIGANLCYHSPPKPIFHQLMPYVHLHIITQDLCATLRQCSKSCMSQKKSCDIGLTTHPCVVVTQCDDLSHLPPNPNNTCYARHGPATITSTSTTTTMTQTSATTTRSMGGDSSDIPTSHQIITIINGTGHNVTPSAVPSAPRSAASNPPSTSSNMVTAQNEMLTTDSGNVQGTGMQHKHAITGGGALPGGDDSSPTVHPVSPTVTTHAANAMMTTSRVNSSVVETTAMATSMASNMVSDTPHLHATSNKGSPGSGPVLPNTDKTSSTVQPATVKSSEAPTTASSSVVLGMAAGVGALILLLLLVLLVVLLKRRAKMGSFTLLSRTRVSVSLTMMNSAFQHISTQEEDHELWQGGSVMNVYETSTTLGNSRASLALRTSGSEFNADINQDEADAYLRTADELNMSRRLSTDTTVTLMSVHTQSSETNLSEYNAAAESPSNSASSDAHLPTKGAGDGANFQPSAKPAKRTLLGRKASVAPSVPMDLTEEIYTSPTRTPLAASRDESSLDISLNTRSKSGLASDTYALPVDVIASHTASRLCSSTTKITDTSADLHTVHIHTDDDYCTPKDAIHKVKKFLETESIDVTGRHDSAEQAAGGTAGTRTSANDDKTNTSLTALAQSQPTVPLQQGSLGNDYLEGTKHRSFDRELEFLTNLLQSEAASGDSVTGNQGLLKSDHVPSLVTVQEDPIKFRPVSASDTTLCQTPTARTHSTATDVVSTTKANPALAGQTATSDECYASPADAVRHLATDVYAEETYQLPNDAVRSVIGNTCKDDAAATPREPTQVRRSESRPTSIALSGASGAQQGVLLVEEDTYIMPADSIKPGTVRHTAQSGITPTTDSDMVTHQATTSTVSTTDPGADIADAYQLPADIKLEQAAASRTDEAGLDPGDTYAMPADAIGVRSTPKAEAQIVAPSTIAAHNPTDPTPRREVYAQVQPKSQRMRETGDSNVSSHSSGAGEPTTATPSVAGAAPPTIPRRYRKTSWHGEQADIDIGNQQYKSSKWSNMFSHVKRKISAGSERRTDMKQPGSPRTSRPLPSPLPEEVAPGNLIKKIDDSNALAEEPQYMLCGPQLISQLSMPSDTTSLSKMAAALPALPRRNTAPPAPEDVLGPIYSLATTSTLSGQAATAEKAHDNASTSSSITHVHTFESDLDQEMYAELQVQDTPQRLLPATDNTSQIDTAMLQNTSNVIPDCSSEEVYAEIGVDKIDKKSTSNADSCYAAPVDAIVSACASNGTRGQDETYAAVGDAITSACE
eukprot:scpid19624/ scgid24587/ 